MTVSCLVNDKLEFPLTGNLCDQHCGRHRAKNIWLTLTTLWVNSADDTLMFSYFPKNIALTTPANCFLLRRQFAWIFKAYFLLKKSMKNISKCSLLKFLPNMRNGKNMMWNSKEWPLCCMWVMKMRQSTESLIGAFDDSLCNNWTL